MQNGKGDERRPMAVSQKTFNDNWDAIFGKKTPPKQEKPKPKKVKG